MRTRSWRTGVVGVLAGAAVLHGLGCISPCELSQSCPPEEPTSGAGGATPEGCVPSANSGVMADGCGVFVSRTRGADTNDGTKAKPLQTMGAALARAEEKGTRVYACAETYEERLEMRAGSRIFGGLDCTQGWVYVGDTVKAQLIAKVGEIPLTVRGGEGIAQLDDVHVKARSITPGNAALRGASSIAMVLDGVAVELNNSVIQAGDAAPGAEGEAYTTEGMGGGIGNAGGVACSASNVAGGDPIVNDCGTPDDETNDSFSGGGGNGTAVSGNPGGPGGPGGADNGGSGEGATACTAGTAGNKGAEGGAGAGATGLGSISASGYVGVAGGGGTRGATAQGGGGGGGAKGGTGAGKCPSSATAGGASGGSGGSGGCGGAGGKGGGPGGASIAIVSIDAQIAFNGVMLETGQGGAGGPGGAGQPGGAGGSGGPGGVVPGTATLLKPGCAGGTGGMGGTGGKGGGGRGGHSIAVVYQGAAPSTQGVTLKMGETGVGGPGADATYDGDPGIAADKMEFPR